MKERSFETIDDAAVAFLRQKSDAERLHVAGEMWKSARAILRRAIQTGHPDWDAEQVNQEIARQIRSVKDPYAWAAELGVQEEWQTVRRQLLQARQ